MLLAAEDQITRRQDAELETVPAPILGWNTRDKNVKRKDSRLYAPIWRNWIIADGKLIVRPGYAVWSTGLPAGEPVETIMEYTAEGSSKTFAVTNDEVYDVTGGGAVPAAETIAGGLSNSVLYSVMTATLSAPYLVCVNGADGVITYDGSAWAVQTITGATAANFIGVTNHVARLWFIENNTLKAWYLAVNAIAGAATAFNIGPLCKRGGTLIAISNWSVADTGAGLDDILVMITSEGEVAVFEGIDPASAETFALKGVYQVDKPVGRRCVSKFGSDLAILTESGVVLLSSVISAGPDGKVAILSDPIRDEFVRAVGGARTDPGWEITRYSARGWTMVNVPLPTTSHFDQYVYNPLAPGWFRLTDMDAYCWQTSGSKILFGALGAIYRWDDGVTRGDIGTAVVADIGLSWHDYGSATNKTFTLMRPHFLTDGTVAPLANMRTDYDEALPSSGVEASVTEFGSEWDDDAWDDAEWGGGMERFAPWLTASGEGIIAAPRIVVSTLSSEIQLQAVDVVFVPGGIL